MEFSPGLRGAGAQAYGASVGFVVCAQALRWLVDLRWPVDGVFVFYHLAVAAAALTWGLGPGIAAVGASALAALLFHGVALPHLVLFTAAGIGLAGIGAFARTRWRRREADLSRNARGLQHLIDSLPQLISYVDSEQRYRFNNRAYQDWFGLSANQTTGRHLREVLGEEAYEVIRPHVEKALAGDEVTYETFAPYKAGGGRHIRASYIPFREEPDGPVKGFFVLVNDVSDRVQVRQQLESRAAQQQAVARLGEVALRSEDLELLFQGTLSGVCETLGTSFGAILQHATGDRWITRALRGWEGDPGWAQCAHTLAGGEPVIMEDARKEHRFDAGGAARLGARCGLSVPIEGDSGPWGVLSAHDGSLRGFSRDDIHFLQAVANVLSAALRRDAAERSLHRRLEQLAAIYEVSDVTGRAGTIEEVYAAALKGLRRATQADRASILLFDLDGVMRFKAWDGVSDAYRSRTTGHSPWTRDTVDPQPVTVPDAASVDLGELREVILHEGIRALGFVPLVAEGRLIGKFMIYYDAPHAFTEEDLRLAATIGRHVASAVERHRREQELRALNETLENRVQERTREAERRAVQLRALALDLIETEERERRLLAQSLHDDLQQILVAARMKLGHVVRGDKAALQPAQELLQDALRASRRITLDLSPPILFETGLVPALEWLVRHMRDKYGLEVKLEARPGGDAVPERQRAFLFRAARELLFNVVKHADSSGAAVLLERAGQDAIALEVRDSGRGFHPAAALGTGDVGGFGLFSIKERAEALGGRLEVNSAPGAGTQVRLVVETREEDEASRGAGTMRELARPLARAEAGAPRTRRAGAGPIRVLLADDHKIVREGLAALLAAQEDMETVAQAADGEEAVSLAVRLKPDVVVMDVSMPRLSGIEATRRITSQAPSVKVIGLSMFENEEMSTSMKNAGASAYLTKDRASETLCDLIRLQSREVVPGGEASSG